MELLSPAGNFDSLIAAVQNGADAVYVGAQNFSARNLADNFSDLSKAASYAHASGVKLYLALNTLVRDREIKRWLETAQAASDASVDAFILQDLGCAMLLKSLCPSIPLHASTQMTAHNADHVRRLQELGFERIILSRELSFSEIYAISSRTGAELEIFVHGALCTCYSGQCLMSSIFGGRSANRGLCAQPCRLDYRAGNKSGRLLSTRDLCLIDHIFRIRQAGIASIKIEGRMKPAGYVGTVTRIYRKALDGGQITKQDKEDLLRAYSRRGFTNLPFTGNMKTAAPISMPLPTPPVKKDNCFDAYKPLKKGKRKKPRKLAAQVQTLSQAKAVLPLVDILYIPIDAKWAVELKQMQKEGSPQLIGVHPLISHEGEQTDFDASLFDGELFGTLTKTNAEHKISGASLHVTNGETLKTLRSLGFERATVSVELNAAQITDLPDVMPTEMIAYGRLTLMTTMHCPLHCDKKNCRVASGRELLTDRMGKRFPLRKTGSGCRVEILNSAPIYMADRLSQVSANVIRLLFTIETPQECVKITREYRDAMAGKPVSPPSDFTRGHFTRGVK